MSKPDPKSVTPPALAAPAATPTEITSEAAAAGEAEGKKLRKRTGRRATQLTVPGFMTPARVERAGLKTTLG
jgi:hypothetical protein